MTAKALYQEREGKRAFAPVVARTITHHTPIAPTAHDWVKVIFYRSGSAIGTCPLFGGHLTSQQIGNRKVISIPCQARPTPRSSNAMPSPCTRTPLAPRLRPSPLSLGSTAPPCITGKKIRHWSPHQDQLTRITFSGFSDRSRADPQTGAGSQSVEGRARYPA